MLKISALSERASITRKRYQHKVYNGHWLFNYKILSSVYYCISTYQKFGI